MIPSMRSVRRPSVRLPERADGHPCRNRCVNTRNVLRETRPQCRGRCRGRWRGTYRHSQELRARPVLHGRQGRREGFGGRGHGLAASGRESVVLHIATADAAALAAPGAFAAANVPRSANDPKREW